MSTPFGQIIQPILSGLENQLGNINESYSAPLLRPQESSPQQTQSTLASDTLQVTVNIHYLEFMYANRRNLEQQ